MSQIRPKILLGYGRINQPIKVPLEDLLVNALQVVLASARSVAGATLTVANTAGFAVNQVLLLGEPGTQECEIVKTHASTAPTATVITLSAGVAQSHAVDTPVYLLGYDKVELSNAPTVAGTKTVLSGSPFVLTPVVETTNVNDTVNSGGFYFARFYNSIGAGSYSAYSDPAPYGGYTLLSARSIIDNALGEINKSQSATLTDDFAFQQLDNFQSEVLSEQKRWSFMQAFNANIGEVATGVWKIACPTDLDDQFTNKGIWNFRIGTQRDMIFVDKEKWNEIVSGVATTTLGVAIVVGAATITLTDSSDFADGGTVQIADHEYAYTANDRSTGILTLTAVSTTTDSLNADVFQGASFGDPNYWTIFNGYLYHWPVAADTYDHKNYYLDYYKSQTRITKDSDVLVIPDAPAASYYLQWKFLKRLNNGQETAESAAAKSNFAANVAKIKQKDSLGRTFRLKPLKNSINVNSPYGSDSKSDRLQGWET